MMRRAFLWFLCAALAAGAPVAGAASEQPCDTAVEGHAGAEPCDCGDAGASNCALDCSIVSTTLTLASGFDEVEPASATERVVVAANLYFLSLTGPPVLQPPR